MVKLGGFLIDNSPSFWPHLFVVGDFVNSNDLRIGTISDCSSNDFCNAIIRAFKA
jgi:hypothetical protein